MTDTIRLAHLSDTHLGLEAFGARTSSGHNARGADLVGALHRAVKGICEWDPPLVIHSGDLFESPAVPIRYLLGAQIELCRLAGLRPDGTRRAVVIIAGNHDTSRNLRDGCQLDLFSRLPGIHVASTSPQRITFDPADGFDPSLENLVVWAVPHDSLRNPAELDQVQPTPGATNVLVAHGVAGGDRTFRRLIGREFPVPSDLLAAGWDYVALGHWHTQGPISAAGTRNLAWYAGSTECVDFSDLGGRTSCSERAWLEVVLGDGGPQVTSRTFPTRHMLAPEPVEAATLTPEQVTEALCKQLDELPYDGAVVRQRVVGITRDLWTLVDLAPVRERAQRYLHHRVEAICTRAVPADQPDGDQPSLGDLDALLRDQVNALVPDADRGAVLARALQLLEAAIGAPIGEGDGTDQPDGDQPGTDQPGTDQPDGDQPALETPQQAFNAILEEFHNLHTLQNHPSGSTA